MANEVDDGGPAFPQMVDDMGTIRSLAEGMTMREYYAAAALPAMIARSKIK